MLDSFKRLFLGIALVAVASGILLYSDLRNRNRSQGRRNPSAAAGKQFRVALVQHASQAVLDDGVRGVLEALAARGYSEGGKLVLRRYNAEADLPTANSIAKDVVSAGNDLIITASTISMQTVANANKFAGQTPHVFGLVSDPYSAGVGINRTNHLDHPPYMAGYGTMQPIAEAFQMARQMRPELKTVGLVWNPTESNSEAQTRVARMVCGQMGITLVEVNAENSSGVAEAANSVISRGVEAIFVTGDVTVLVATDAVINAAKRGKIPVFTVIPPTAKKGALFDLGANYHEIGKATGNLAADVLEGRRTAEIPVENLVPESLVVNLLALEGLKDQWQMPEAVTKRASMIIDATGTHSRVTAATGPLRVPPGRNFKIGLAYYAPEPSWENCVKGIFDGLRALGLEEGKNLEVRRAHAQGEIPNIPAMLQNFDGSDVDLIVAMTTPVIGGACGLVKRKPVVLTYCSDPIAAGAGQSFTNHLPHMTGIGTFPPVQEMVNLIRETVPGIKRVGTIYNASEANSRKVVEVARDLFARSGIKLEEATVTSSSEVSQAAQALVSRNVEAFYIQGDNTVAQAFDVVVKAVNDARLPLFNDDPDFAGRGAVACVGVGYYESGRAAAAPIVRVLLGESPAGIPLENVSQRKLILNKALAQKLGLSFPAEVVAAAAKEKASATEPGAGAEIKPPARKFRIELIEYLDTPNVEFARQGVLDAFQAAGWLRGVNIDVRLRNAQGDIATLSSLVDAAVTDNADVIIASTTPALQGALRRCKGRPLVFTLVANPIVAGAGRSDSDHLPFVTGSYVSAPFEEGLRRLMACLPGTKRIGTLYVPAEVNSVYYKEQLEATARKFKLEVETLGVSSSGEVADGALALCGRNIDVFCQLSDNLTGASFASIAQAAKKSRIPLVGFAPANARMGAFMTVSMDFYDNGMASGRLAMRVLNGEDPAKIPFEAVRKTRFLVNLATAAQLGITIPEGLVKSADEVIR
jgi:ABC-type uncharacterized transport system substrate-binding protein